MSVQVGTLCLKTFTFLAKEWVKLGKKFSFFSEWELVENENQVCFLKRKDFVRQHYYPHESSEEITTFFVQEGVALDLENDPGRLFENDKDKGQICRIYELHIVYSTIYRVPVLYFQDRMQYYFN
mmetsp:Transcript_21975/g.26782  ORF Transcript_21975/g.26782 Transcript_21975/m.26782 type:complete len:125 (+) Transcript_21975:190-564(+)